MHDVESKRIGVRDEFYTIYCLGDHHKDARLKANSPSQTSRTGPHLELTDD